MAIPATLYSFIMQTDPSIFKAYDIRGTYGKNLNEEIAYKIGRAYCELLAKENSDKKLQLVVSHDMRLSSPSLSESLINGILDSGHDVIDIKLSSTPTFYFAVAFYGYDGGIQVSASHNPKDDNGFKMVRAKSVPVSIETGIAEIRDMVITDKFSQSKTKGTITKKENVISDEFREEAKGIDLKQIKPLKIVVDAANSMGAVDMEELFSHLPCQLIKVNFNLDGSFPSHQPDPLVEDNLALIKQEILKHKADFGIAPDGDGDRYFIVDEKGETIRQEILRGIMAQQALITNPHATVAYDIRPGKITLDMILEAGGKPIVTKVGHSLIKESMLKNDAVFGGESSGHYFYKFPFGTFEAPIKQVLEFLVFVSKQNKPLSEIVNPYRSKYTHSGEINSKVADAKAKMKEIAQVYAKGEISLLDGITVTFPDFWFNVRASNTEPLLRLNLEAISKEVMEQKRDEVLALIRK